MNYAEALESEAYVLAKRRLIRQAEGTNRQDRLDGWLARLDVIHARNMELAAQWGEQNMSRMKHLPLTPAMVTDQQRTLSAFASAAAALADED